jgi:hypothetical protein
LRDGTPFNLLRLYESIAVLDVSLGSIPDNFKLTASVGGKFDDSFAKYELKSATVVFSEAEAQAKGLPLDHDDSHCWKQNKSFAFLLHGTQPPKSDASRALMSLRKLGIGGYKADYFQHYADK